MRKFKAKFKGLGLYLRPRSEDLGLFICFTCISVHMRLLTVPCKQHPTVLSSSVFWCASLKPSYRIPPPPPPHTHSRWTDEG